MGGGDSGEEEEEDAEEQEEDTVQGFWCRIELHSNGSSKLDWSDCLGKMPFEDVAGNVTVGVSRFRATRKELERA